MATMLKIKVNEQVRTVSSAPDTPLLYVLTDELNLQGPRFADGVRNSHHGPGQPANEQPRPPAAVPVERNDRTRPVVRHAAGKGERSRPGHRVRQFHYPSHQLPDRGVLHFPGRESDDGNAEAI